MKDTTSKKMKTTVENVEMTYVYMWITLWIWWISLKNAGKNDTNSIDGH